MSIFEKELLFSERKRYEDMFYKYCEEGILDKNSVIHPSRCIMSFIVWMMCNKEGAELAQKVLNYHMQKAINRLG